jgi:hypothetical protein
VASASLYFLLLLFLPSYSVYFSQIKGRVDIGIELVVDLKFEVKQGVRALLEWVNKDCVYAHSHARAHYTRTGAVLHLETETSEAPVQDEARRYTFVKRRNELYRGSSLV